MNDTRHGENVILGIGMLMLAIAVCGFIAIGNGLRMSPPIISVIIFLACMGSTIFGLLVLHLWLNDRDNEVASGIES